MSRGAGAGELPEAWDRPNNLFPRAAVPPDTKRGAPSLMRIVHLCSLLRARGTAKQYPGYLWVSHVQKGIYQAPNSHSPPLPVSCSGAVLLASPLPLPPGRCLELPSLPRWEHGRCWGGTGARQGCSPTFGHASPEVGPSCTGAEGQQGLQHQGSLRAQLVVLGQDRSPCTHRELPASGLGWLLGEARRFPRGCTMPLWFPGAGSTLPSRVTPLRGDAGRMLRARPPPCPGVRGRLIVCGGNPKSLGSRSHRPVLL